VVRIKNLNQLLKLPVLEYKKNNNGFVFEQIDKLHEEIEEFENEKDELKKCCELFDVLQVSLSLLDIFNVDTIDQAYRLNMQKHRDRDIFKIVGKYEIFKIMHKKTE